MKIAAWITVGLETLVLALLAICAVLNLSLGGRPMPALAGNRPENLAKAASGGGDFRVAVMGDSQKGFANFANLIRAVKEEKVDFILHTGDLVAENDDGHYRLAALALDRAGLEVPFLVVPGNHDVKKGAERFLREFGGTEFAFRRGAVTFIGVDNALGEAPDIQQIESRIRATARADDRVVLLLHVPPFDVRGEIIPLYEEFARWLEKGMVHHVFSGQVHDYIQKGVGKAMVVANGVGGDYESWQLKQKVYATILSISGSGSVVRPLSIPPEHGFVSNLEHLAVGHVAEAFRRRPVACWIGTLALVPLVLVSLRLARRK